MPPLDESAPFEPAPVEIEDIGSNPARLVAGRETLAEIAERRLSRRTALLGLAALTQLPAAAAAESDGPSSLGFTELSHRLSQRDAVAPGHEIQTVIRWGDPVLADAPAFDPQAVTAAAQAQQFGYNNDYVDYLPLPHGSQNSEHGLLVVNHEYTNTNMMFPGLGAGRSAALKASAAQAAAEMAAHGMSVVELRREGGRWSPVAAGRLNRRITAETPIRIGGPAAGHERLRTNADPTGTQVLGTLNNCSGGNTPWGTVLTAEENFNVYFGGAAATTGEQKDHYRRYGILSESLYSWSRHTDRFNLDKEPNEPNRFGWVVEFDPYDPTSVPVKRTALGHFKHECCNHAISADGRVAIYMGDDERFEYIYKFVTARRWHPTDRAANRDLLDEGTLFVARCLDDGRLEWLPLVHGEGPLTAANGFASQAEVLIETRRAADLLGATPMDRPEDVEPNPLTGRIYAMLTNNTARGGQRLDRANPRAANAHGHVVELIPPGAGTSQVDHVAPVGRWEIFLLAGKPGVDAGARYHRATSDQGWLSCPDNCTFDRKGRIWIATDGAPSAAGVADGLYAADTAGYGRGLTRLFYQAPTGAEVCGPCFTPDGETIFLAIQHPGEEAGSSFERPTTRWPDFQPGMPPRPSVIAITRKGGGEIGS
ncbi:PhoX family protein [Paeniroseomonas aquatica]|uniref:PhoX family protein n=1 Tax=Paeniroseomonas aquatica TaxID=373043 RepID=UPI00361FBD27